MAVSTKQLALPLPFSGTVGQSYSATYLRSKQDVLKQRLEWAKSELEMKYKSAEAARKAREEMFAAIEKDKDALRQERAAYDIKIAQLRAQEAKARKREGDTPEELIVQLLQERRQAAEAQTKASVDVSGQRVDLLKIGQDQYTAPVGATDQISRATATASTAFRVPQGRDIDTAIDNYILRDASLPAAFNGLTQGQKQAAAIHLYRETAQAITSTRGNQALSIAEEQRIKDNIETRFGIPAVQINEANLEINKKAGIDQLVKKAGATTAEIKSTIGQIDAEIERLRGGGELTSEQRTELALSKSLDKVSDYLSNATIEAIQNDGAIDPNEAAAIERVMLERIGTAAAAVGQDPAVVLDRYKKQNSLDTKATMVESNLFNESGSAVMQTYIKEGTLNKRQKDLGLKPMEAPTTLPTITDVMTRGAELYQPARTRRGFGEIAPYYSRETATARRAMEQGVPLTPSMGPAGRMEAPFQPVAGTVGRQAPVSKAPPRRFTGADELFSYTQMAQKDILSSGQFLPRTLDETAATVATDIAKRLADGSLKAADLQSEVTRLTIGSGLYDTPEAGKKAKEDILYNVIGEDFYNFKAKMPAPPRLSEEEPVAPAIAPPPVEAPALIPAPAAPPQDVEIGDVEEEEEDELGGSPERILPNR